MVEGGMIISYQGHLVTLEGCAKLVGYCLTQIDKVLLKIYFVLVLS
jgi:hypothetical protein